ncbi:integrative conjugative element protein, RAQPRD family [Halopseudomonas litoralis]|uniref:Integrative conjugative element protein, RAQPRD family n=1 Tax=Halopseudomonas litoralis TaxID=797277 RepID=A0A1H1Q2V7_9GAMM|nr:RAQPRD family integrative conjugative element protein [Halopseudomonas litoralis]SDS17734.1 integrative conjugative element protein, RAQPRD family [Halopseudomonas litoralis]
MVLISRRGIATRSATALFITILMAGAPLLARGETPTHRSELAAAVRQLNALERLVVQSAAQSQAAPGERYHFDYPRLLADLERVRTGIQGYLTPVRAQPRDPVELIGAYRADNTPSAELQP